MSWVRKKKKYSKPGNMYDSVRIEEEGNLVAKYGLKNMKEVWKAQTAIDKIREQAKNTITAEEVDQEKLFDKLDKMGFNVEKISDVLALDGEDWLKRRLQTIVYEKGLASTIKEARQLVVHGHIKIGDRVVNVPSYVVRVDEEDKIKKTLKQSKKEGKMANKEIKKEKENGERE